MVAFSKSFQLSLSLLASTVIASPTPSQLESRAVINSDAVVGFAETVPSGTVGVAYKAYKPHLYVINGCVPFPAVDASGNTGGGLATTGSSNGDCSSSTGQIYVRGAQSGSYYGIMYSWYMPKDEPSAGLGHRHDWEGTIVWLSSSTSTTAANIVAVCPSAHGGWDCSTDGYSLTGTSPLIKYESIWPINHSCGLTSTVGGQQPMIAWESLTTAAQTALETTSFGDGNVPFIPASFANNLAKATF
ncbi:putative necrosis and ethylene inducing peptide 2 precursor [Sclerotinia borealis F-4128]|uniref:Putative necrosis and ethylene inducing peptide 2 n=1 Tax=Sclerotinia borealis (strain F-4128) TaxID=1432307 RepID=W9CFW8_SCLBF|nr:putative necrosis and ethylene inducing peptide 2 precursor [Sclerotinia borealis F-4128]